jgi:Ca-activated chloride channel family protein
MKILGVFFLYPKWFWAIAAIPLLYMGGRLLLSNRKARFAKFAEEPVWGKIAPELDWKLPLKKLFFWCLSLLFLFVAMARPQWGESEEIMKTTGLDIMMIVDVSASMMAEDVVPSRMKKAQHFIRRFLERAAGDRVGLVAFAGNSVLLSPLTTDLDYVGETADTLSTDSVTAQGTDIGAGLETALNALARGAEDNSGKETQAPVSRSIILISDGEDNEDRINEIVASLKKENLKVYVFGIGTEKGGPIPVRDPEGQTVGFKRDRAGKTVITQFNPTSLRKLATDADGKFWAITPSENELDDLMSELGALSRGENSEKKVTIRKERFQWPLAIALFLMFVELGMPSRKNSAVIKRAGATTALLVLALGIGSARADDFRAYEENDKAVKAFAEDKVAEAKEHFSNAQVEDPRSPALRFNQGAVHLKEEKFEEASRVYGEAAESAKLDQRPGLAAAALYNQGIAKTAKKDLEGAVESYLAALEENAHEPNAELEPKIRKNLELLFEAKKSEGKSGDSKDKDDKESDKKDKSDQNKSGNKSGDGDKDDKKKDEGGDKKKDEPQKYSESNGKREFKSEKLSKEDAARVMAELSRREKDLQDKMKRSKGRPQPLEKDW